MFFIEKLCLFSQALPHSVFFGLSGHFLCPGKILPRQVIFPHGSVELSPGSDSHSQKALCPDAVSYTHLDVYKRQLFALSPPIYFSSAVFYTDFLSIIFPVLSFYLFLLGMESIGRKKRLLWLSLSCLVLAVGSLIKITVLITLIAMALYCIRYKKFRRALFLTAAGGLLAAAVTLSFQGYLYSHHLDRDCLLYTSFIRVQQNH